MPILGAGGGGFFAGVRPGVISNIANLPNLQVWYDATDTTVFTPTVSDGSTFTQWGDKSAFAHNANPSGGASARPTYQTNELNGKSVVQFDGVNDNLTINPATWAASISGYSAFLVMKATTLSGTRTLTSSDQNGIKIFYNGSHWAVSTSGGTGTSTVVGDTTKYHIVGLIFDGAGATNADRLKFRYDETQQTLSFTGTVGATTSASTSIINIGFYNNSEYFGGYIAEMIFTSKALTGSDIAGIEEYLSLKWNL